MKDDFESLYQRMADREHWLTQPRYRELRYWISTREFAGRTGLTIVGAYAWLRARCNTTIVGIRDNAKHGGNKWKLRF